MLQEEYLRIEKLEEYTKKHRKIFLYNLPDKKKWFISDRNIKESQTKTSPELDYVTMRDNLKYFYDGLVTSMLHIEGDQIDDSGHHWDSSNKNLLITKVTIEPRKEPVATFLVGGIEWKFISVDVDDDLVKTQNIYILQNPIMISGINLANYVRDVTVELYYDKCKFPTINCSCTNFYLGLSNFYKDEFEIIDNRSASDKFNYDIIDTSNVINDTDDDQYDKL